MNFEQWVRYALHMDPTKSIEDVDHIRWLRAAYEAGIYAERDRCMLIVSKHETAGDNRLVNTLDSDKSSERANTKASHTLAHMNILRQRLVDAIRKGE